MTPSHRFDPPVRTIGRIGRAIPITITGGDTAITHSACGGAKC